MPDTFVRIKHGEKQPVYGQETPASGTLTIAASPAPTCTLYNSAGAVVSGYSAIAVTGYDSGAQASPRIWLDLDTLSPTDLAAGFYTLVFQFSATGSDSIAPAYEPNVEIQVRDGRS